MRKVGLSLLLSFSVVAACKSARGEREPEQDTQPGTPTDTTSSSTGTSEDMLQATAEGLSLEDQKRVFLVQRYLDTARDLLDRLRLDEAATQAQRALELNPESLRAKELLAEIAVLTGEDYAGSDTVAEELGRRYELKVQQLRADAEDAIQRGRLAQSRGDYDTAVAEFTLANDHVRWADYTIDWEGLDVEAQQLLDQALAERDTAKREIRQREQQAALEAIRAEEEAEAKRRAAMVTEILDAAITSYNEANYDEAYDLAERVLQIDPRHQRALEVRDAAFRSGRKQVRESYVRSRRERFVRWQQELDELRIPYTGVITLPDEEFWREITEIRSRRTGTDLSATVSPSDLELRTSTVETRIPGFIVSEEESLNEVVRNLRTLTGLPLVVDPLAEEAAFDEGAVFDFNFQNALTVEKALNLITDAAGPDVTWTVRHDAILVTTRDKARGKLTIYNHDVQDLIFGLTDFLGPKIDRLRLLDELEDDDGGGPFGGIGERPTIIEPDDLATLVQENVAVETWEDEGVSINVELGNMIVVHTPEVQIQVRQFLEDLRRFSSSLVTIESKFMRVEDNWLQEIGVDFRGIDNDGDPFTDLDDVTNGLEDSAAGGLDNSGTGSSGTNAAGPPSAGFFFDDGEDGDFKARTENLFGTALGETLSTIGGFTGQWQFINDLQFSMIVRLTEKSSKVELINDQVLSVHNTQRAYVTVVNQRAYIQDFDVEVAQFQSVADPQINVLTEGIVLDVRPTIHHDRKYLTLEVQPTVAQVVALRDFSTSLGSQTLPVSFQLPELEVQSVFTTAVVPDGGSILLGGLSRIRNVERRAEIPWLSNIPIIGFFFKEEGYNDEKQSLMILLRAWITDVKEAVQDFEKTGSY